MPAYQPSRTKLLCILAVAGALACDRNGRTTETARVPQGPSPSPAPAAVPAAAPPTQPVVREEVAVRTGEGEAPERWALVWRQTPKPVCEMENPSDALTCPCAGFAYGEMGKLDLVRRRPGLADESLPLVPYFTEGENPGWGDSAAVLQRWPVRDSDYAALADTLAAPIDARSRPATRAMVLGDYDRDGRATEFLLQVGAFPCGHRAAVLVGVSRAKSALHAFASVAHPERPLVLEPHIWATLLQRRNATAIEWQCGDHGGETQREVSLRAGPAGIDGVRSEYRCTADDTKGRLLHSERI